MINPTGLLVLSKEPLTVARFEEFHPGIPAVGKHGYLTAKVTIAIVNDYNLFKKIFL